MYCRIRLSQDTEIQNNKHDVARKAQYDQPYGTAMARNGEHCSATLIVTSILAETPQWFVEPLGSAEYTLSMTVLIQPELYDL